RVVLLTIALRHAHFNDNLAELHRNPSLCRLLDIRAAGQIPHGWNLLYPVRQAYHEPQDRLVVPREHGGPAIAAGERERPGEGLWQLPYRPGLPAVAEAVPAGHVAHPPADDSSDTGLDVIGDDLPSPTTARAVRTHEYRFTVLSLIPSISATFFCE